MVDGVLVDTRLFLGGTFCLTVAAWLAVGRAIAGGSRCRPRFCPECGFDIAARLARRDAVPMTRPASACVDTPCAAVSGVLPSNLLRGGWSCTVQPAADAAGRPVFPAGGNARFFTIWAAGNHAFDGSPRRVPFFRALQAILRERYGGVTVLKWNRDPARTQEEVVAVAVAAEAECGSGGVI